MELFFIKNYPGEPFHLFGLAHLIVVGIILFINIALIRFGEQFPLNYRAPFRYILTMVLILNEAAWHLWSWLTGQWDIQMMLPLHLCSLSVMIGAIMLITKNYFAYEFIYLLGISGAFLACLTPALDKYGFPHFLFFQFFISHGGIIIAGIFMTVVEGYRPFYKSILRVFLVGNLALLLAAIVNANIGSNYFFIAHKPETASPFDWMPPWPWYILVIIPLSLVFMWLVYLPFAWRDRNCEL